MIRTTLSRALSACTVALTVMAGAVGTAQADTSALGVARPASQPATEKVCAKPTPGHAQCLAQFQVPAHAAGLNTAADPVAYGPADLHSAYKLPWTGGADQTVAIVDAYDNPNAEADLATYRAHYGLPPCSTDNGCFTKVNQRGETTNLPEPDAGWGGEISLDVDMVSAVCPSCHILLVEADTAGYDDLGPGVDTAVRLGATAVSNSYSGPEYNGIEAQDVHYHHPGVPILASSGDAGFQPAGYPASSSSVIAVGGTSLNRASNSRGWTEAAWSGSGSGCSAWMSKPSWQHDKHCPMRMVSDVSAVADPETGVAIYDTFGYPGWLRAGGTSASSPIIAGVIALAGNGKQIDNASYIYARAKQLNDVVAGSNGYPASPWSRDCGGDYVCNAVRGYDGPTGLGTPNGLGAF
jgi:subtilase family serine protease